MPKQAEMDAPGLRQGSCSDGDRRGEVAGRSVVGARGWSSLRRSLGAAGVAACLLAAIAASAQAAPVPSDFTLAGSNTREATGGPLVTVDGTLRTWHGDTFTVPVGVGAGIDTGIAGLYRLADLDPGEAAALAGKRVHGIGELRGTVLSVRGGSIEATEEAASPAAVGVATVAVLLFNFTGDQRQPWTQSTVRSVVFDGAASVNAYYQNASYGKLSLAGDVFGWYTIAASNSGCDYGAWANQARSKAIGAGVPLAGYTYTVYAFPYVTGCGWAGLANLPGPSSWINGYMQLGVVAHELGHNFGTHHASSYACGSVVYTPTGCTTSEYGDPFSVMGNASRRLHTGFSRAQYGYLDDTLTVTTTGVYTIAPVEQSPGVTSRRQLQIPRGSGTYLYLDYRQPFGVFDDYSPADPAVNGVQIRFNSSIGIPTQTKLLDAHPGGSFVDAGFRVGESWQDPVSGARVSVISVSPVGADVYISFGSDANVPAPPSGLTATALSRSEVGLVWTDGSSNETGFRIERSLNGTTGWHQVGTVAANVTAFPYSRQTPFTTFFFRVRATSGVGSSAYSNVASATTLGS